MRPNQLTTRIYLDGGDSEETKEMLDLLGFLDGQTTNPTLISKNPEAQKRLLTGKKFSVEEIYNFYRSVVTKISELLPNGSVSIEVYTDFKTTAREMLEQGKEMYRWVPNAHIKFPITKEGLLAAEEAVKEGYRVNMTLCFSEAQAAAVYAATRGAAKGQVYLSPFIGRLDDQGQNGMDLVKNIIKLYQEGDGHVEVLAASVRNTDHLLAALQVGADIVTVPSKVLRGWKKEDLSLPPPHFIYEPALEPIFYQEFDLEQSWKTFDISHSLTTQGIQKFSEDWNALLK